MILVHLRIQNVKLSGKRQECEDIREKGQNLSVNMSGIHQIFKETHEGVL